MNIDNNIEYGKIIANTFNKIFNQTYIKCIYCDKIYNYYNIKEWRIITKCGMYPFIMLF